MCKRKKISINLDVHMLADLDNENDCDLYANEHRKDGLKSKYTENVLVQNGVEKLRHLLIFGLKLTEFAGTFTCVSTRRLVT